MMDTASANAPPLPREGRRRLELETALFSGLGFALGFGWLWFAALQTVWLPEFLWGHLLWGGGTTLFAVVTLIGFFLVGALFRLYGPKVLSEQQKHGVRTGQLSHFVHAVSLLLVVCSIFFSDSQTASDYLPAACLALAAIPLGVYWVAVLLFLPPRQAMVAFIMACAVSTVLALIVETAPKYTTLWIFCGAIGAAWVAAVGLSKVLRQLRLVSRIISLKTENQKRPRGRPQQVRPDISSTWQEDLHWSVLFVAPMLFFLAGLADAGIVFGTMTFLEGKSLNAFLVLGLNCLGALMGLFFSYAQEKTNAHEGGNAVSLPATTHQAPALAICGAFTVQGLVLLCLPVYFPYAFPIVEGAACAAFFALLSVSPPGRYWPPASVEWVAMGRAALVLGSAIFCAHFGHLMSGYTLHANDADLDMGERAAIVTGCVSLAASTVMLFLLVWDRHMLLRSGYPLEATLSALTQRERDIADMVMQDKGNKEISAGLFISEDTVRFHLKNIYRKTGLTSREDLRTLARK